MFVNNKLAPTIQLTTNSCSAAMRSSAEPQAFIIGQSQQIFVSFL
jgi:hypothetical protein